MASCNSTDTMNVERIEFALCGGLAMAVYAFPRATMDIDILIDPDTLEKAKRCARTLGFTFDVGLMNMKKGAVQIYRVTKVDTLSQEPPCIKYAPEVKNY